MATAPENYLSEAYYTDLAVYGASCICGHSTHMFPHDGRADRMHDWQAFALVQYEMNLLQQACHAYGLSQRVSPGEGGWPQFCTTRCPSQSRLIHPVRVLSHFEALMLEARHPRAQRFAREDIVRYDAYFMGQAEAGLGHSEFRHLLRGMRNDPDCDVYRSCASYLRRHGFHRVWQGAPGSQAPAQGERRFGGGEQP